MSRSKHSAGILLYRQVDGGPEVFLVHPGGPLWAKKDQGAWTIPKGELSVDEDPFETAVREFQEEVGFVPQGPFHRLPSVRQTGGKLVDAWATCGDFDPAQLRSNTFTMEWPPRSGRKQEFPEVDRGDWFTLEQAKTRINPAQMDFLTALAQWLGPEE